MKEVKMDKKPCKPTILIDLDGVLNNYIKFDEQEIPEIKKGAKEFLEILYKDYNLVLFTTRNLLFSSKWLCDNGIDKYFIDITNTKVPAMLHIDDRALCFKGDYTKTLDEIKGFRVYWK